MTSGSKKESTAGEMVNLMSVDAQRLMDLMSYVNQIWSAPFQILLALGFLYTTMGVSILAGFGVMLLLIPMNLCVTRIMKRFQVHFHALLYYNNDEDGKNSLSKRNDRDNICNNAWGFGNYRFGILT